MSDYLKERSCLFNEASDVFCPDSCERYGCRDSELHITISLVDLNALSRAFGSKPSSLFNDYCKIGYDPLREEEPWVGRLTIELRKPCPFLEEKKCGVYPGRPMACGLFPEAFVAMRKTGELLQKEIFQKLPCLTHPAPVSYRRREILHKLLQMSAQEIFLSDFDLFGVSPFLVDLKNVAGWALTGIELRGEREVVIPHVRFEALLKERLQGTDSLSTWLSRIRLLDRDEDVKEFWSMKGSTEQMSTLGEKDSSVLVHQFVGNRFEGVHFLR